MSYFIRIPFKQILTFGGLTRRICLITVLALAATAGRAVLSQTVAPPAAAAAQAVEPIVSMRDPATGFFFIDSSCS